MRETVKYLALVIILLIAGCAYNVELISFDTGETLQGGFNVANHEVWVNMARRDTAKRKICRVKK